MNDLVRLGIEKAKEDLQNEKLKQEVFLDFCLFTVRIILAREKYRFNKSIIEKLHTKNS